MTDVVITTEPGTNISTGLDYIYASCISPKFNNINTPRIFVASSPPNQNSGVGFTIRYADLNGSTWGSFTVISNLREDTLNQGWVGITCTRDGTRVIVAGLIGYIYVTTWNNSTLSYSTFTRVAESTFIDIIYSGIKTTSTGNRLVVAATRGTMWFTNWNGISNYGTPTRITVTNSSNTSFAMSTDGSKIVYAGLDNNLYMITWNGTTYTNDVKISTYTATTTYRALEFSGDTRVLYATTNNSNTISYFVWDNAEKNYNERKTYVVSDMPAGIFNKTAIGIINISRIKSQLYIVDNFNRTQNTIYNYNVIIYAPTPIYDVSFDIPNTKSVALGNIQVSINDPDNSIINNLYYMYSTNGTDFVDTNIIAGSESSPYRFYINTPDISNTIYIKVDDLFGNASNIAVLSSVISYHQPRVPPVFQLSLTGSGNLEVTVGETDSPSTIPDYYYLNNVSYLAYIYTGGINDSDNIDYYTTYIGNLSSTNTLYANVVSYFTNLPANKYTLYLAAINTNYSSVSVFGNLLGGPQQEIIVYTIPPYQPIIDTANTITTSGNLTISIVDTSNSPINAIYYLYSLDGGITYGNSGVTNNGNINYTFTVSDTGNASVPLTANTYTLSILASNHFGNIASNPATVNVYTTPISPSIDTENTKSTSSGNLTISIIDSSNTIINDVYYLYSLDGGITYGNSGVFYNGNTNYTFTVSDTGNAFVQLVANTYTLLIRASNPVGNADDSIYTSVNVYTTPQPLIIDDANTISLTSNELTVAFYDLNNSEVNEVYYLVSIDGGNTYANTDLTCNGIPETQYIYTITTEVSNGNSYVVQLKATNTVGNSIPVSTNLTEVFTVPDVPVLHKIIPQIGAIDIVFITSEFNGGNAITKYQYYLNDANDPLAINDISISREVAAIRYATISDLSDGHTYVIGIRAVNARGGSEWSNTQSTIPFRVPDSPYFTAESYDTFIRLIISAPEFNGGNTITEYQYSLYGNSATDASSVSFVLPDNAQYDVSGLLNATTYSVVVRAINARGYSVWSSVALATPNTFPDSPILYSVVAVPNGATITFSTPFDGGTPITGYAYSIDNGNTYTPISDSSNITQYDIAGLTNGETYLVRVKAANKNGLSNADSNMISVTTPNIPDAPIISTVPQNRTIEVSFVTPNNRGKDITGYKYSVDGGNIYSNVVPFPTTMVSASNEGNVIVNTFYVYNASNGREYQIHVKAVNSIGESVSSNRSYAIPRTFPDEPTIVNIQPTDGGVDIVFSASTNIGGNAITGYKLGYVLGRV